MISVLHIVWFLVGLSIQIDNVVLNLQCLSRQTHTALHIVLTTIGGACVNQTILLWIGLNGLFASLIDGVEVKRIRIRTLWIGLVTYLIAHLIEVVSLILGRRTNGVTSGIVEHHDIVELNLAQALHSAIVPMGPFDIRLAFEQRHGVLCQRHGQWGLRNTRSIAYLRDEEIVARQEALLQRTRWNDIVLEEEQVDEIDSHQGKHQGIHPRHHELRRTFGILPPLPLDFLRDIDIINERDDKQSPP